MDKLKYKEKLLKELESSKMAFIRANSYFLKIEKELTEKERFEILKEMSEVTMYIRKRLNRHFD